MTELLVPPVPVPTSPADVTGARSFTEYLAMFGLAAADLAGRRLLDAPAGASAFTAGALARGLDAVASDPGYPPAEGDRRAALAALGLGAEDRVRRAMKTVVAAPGAFRWDYFTDPEDLLRRRLAAARYFAAHAAQQPDRYVPGDAARLPFADDAFGLALCAQPVDGAALAELLRVSPEVRAFGIDDADVPAGVEVTRVSTGYAFDAVRDDVVVVLRR